MVQGSQGGLHVHVGTTCAAAGGHYWDNVALSVDPWTPMKHAPSTSTRTASGKYIQKRRERHANGAL